MHLTTATHTFALALTVLCSLSTLSTASPTSHLAKRDFDSGELQNSLCTTKNQKAVPGYDTSCKFCNCACITWVQEGFYGTSSKSGDKLLQDLSDHHGCLTAEPISSYEEASTNDATYDQDVLGKTQG
ncbi:hypothetical protein MMC11_004614 [Xylographa trunciseda]|nr:hypothetical protein [Xylographa trunciseda]